MATRRILGTVSLSSSSCLATISRPALPDIPVTFPPGRARLAMSPVPTGSRTVIMTTGIVSVAFLAAVTPCVPVPKHRCARHAGCDLFEQLQPLPRHAVFVAHETGGIAAGPRQAVNETRADRIAGDREHNRHCAGRLQ